MKAEGRRPRKVRRTPRRWLFIALLCVGAFGALAATPRLAKVQSKYYLIHSDLDDALVLDLGRRMDAMYDEYSRRMSDFELRPDAKPLDVYLFNKKADYADFTQNRYG